MRTTLTIDDDVAVQLDTQAFDLGPFLVNIDNVAEALAYAEGEGFK